MTETNSQPPGAGCCRTTTAVSVFQSPGWTCFTEEGHSLLQCTTTSTYSEWHYRPALTQNLDPCATHSTRVFQSLGWTCCVAESNSPATQYQGTTVGTIRFTRRGRSSKKKVFCSRLPLLQVYRAGVDMFLGRMPLLSTCVVPAENPFIAL